MHYQRKEHEEAAELWAEVLDVEPSNTTAAVNLGWHYQSQKGGFHKPMEPYLSSHVLDTLGIHDGI